MNAGAPGYLPCDMETGLGVRQSEMRLWTAGRPGSYPEMLVFWEVGKITEGNPQPRVQQANEVSGGQNRSGLRQRSEFGSTSVQFEGVFAPCASA